MKSLSISSSELKSLLEVNSLTPMHEQDVTGLDKLKKARDGGIVSTQLPDGQIVLLQQQPKKRIIAFTSDETTLVEPEITSLASKFMPRFLTKK